MHCLRCEWFIIMGLTQVVHPSSIWGRYLRCPTANAVTASEVNCCDCIVRLRSLPRFAETTSQGYGNAACFKLRDRWLYMQMMIYNSVHFHNKSSPMIARDKTRTLWRYGERNDKCN